MWVFVVLLSLGAVVNGQAASSLLVLNSYTSASPAPVCDSTHFYATTYQYFVKDNLLPVWCSQTPTSTYNYLFVLQGNSSVLIQQFGVNDNNCSAAPIGKQTALFGTCIHLVGDNPAVSYKFSVVNTACGGCSGGTCCWSPNGNQCANAPGACCCPDFQNACPSGQECFCSGTCPGPSCQCQFCGPSNQGGTCLNQD